MPCNALAIVIGEIGNSRGWRRVGVLCPFLVKRQRLQIQILFDTIYKSITKITLIFLRFFKKTLKIICNFRKECWLQGKGRRGLADISWNTSYFTLNNLSLDFLNIVLLFFMRYNWKNIAPKSAISAIKDDLLAGVPNETLMNAINQRKGNEKWGEGNGNCQA